jgi:hypothetical protein
VLQRYENETVMPMRWLDKYGSRERLERRVIETGIWFLAALAFAVVAWLTYALYVGT